MCTKHRMKLIFTYTNGKKYTVSNVTSIGVRDDEVEYTREYVIDKSITTESNTVVPINDSLKSVEVIEYNDPSVPFVKKSTFLQFK